MSKIARPGEEEEEIFVVPVEEPITTPVQQPEPAKGYSIKSITYHYK